MPADNETIVKPTPDPTVLTTEASDRAKAAADHVEELRQAALERELSLRQESREREISDLKHRFSSGRKSDWRLFKAEMKVLEEKFKSQDRILQLMEDQRKERKEDDRISLSAALAAAEKARVADTEASDKANTKTELSTAEQLKQQNTTSSQANSNTVAAVNALTTRVERIENLKQGASEQTTERRANSGSWGLWVGIAVAAFVGFNGLLLTAVGIVATYMLTRQR